MNKLLKLFLNKANLWFDVKVIRHIVLENHFLEFDVHRELISRSHQGYSGSKRKFNFFFWKSGYVKWSITKFFFSQKSFIHQKRDFAKINVQLTSLNGRVPPSKIRNVFGGMKLSFVAFFKNFSKRRKF